MTDVPIPELPPPTPAGRGGRLYRIQPLLAITIALAAIGLAAWEGCENRRHNRLMVQPRLGVEIASGRDDAGEYGTMAIASTGLGPAVARTFRVYLDGELLDVPTTSNDPWAAIVQDLSAADSLGGELRIHTQAFGEGYYFPSGSEQVLFEARATGRPQGAPPLGRLLERIAVDICYCSIYGTDCDRALVAIRPVATEACPSP